MGQEDFCFLLWRRGKYTHLCSVFGDCGIWRKLPVAGTMACLTNTGRDSKIHMD